jgi:hypothetical protein
MSDDVESKMEFIVKQHEVFALDMADLKESPAPADREYRPTDLERQEHHK